MRIAEGAEKRHGDRSRYFMVAVFMVAVFMVAVFMVAVFMVPVFMVPVFMVAVFLVAVLLVQGITDRWDVSNLSFWVCFPMVIGPMEHDRYV
jgi:Flp pilus assembly protein TadB